MPSVSALHSLGLDKGSYNHGMHPRIGLGTTTPYTAVPAKRWSPVFRRKSWAACFCSDAVPFGQCSGSRQRG